MVRGRVRSRVWHQVFCALVVVGVYRVRGLLGRGFLWTLHVRIQIVMASEKKKKNKRNRNKKKNPNLIVSFALSVSLLANKQTRTNSKKITSA